MNTLKYSTDWSSNEMSATFVYNTRKYGSRSIACIGDEEVCVLVPDRLQDKEILLHLRCYRACKHLPDLHKIGWCPITSRGRRHKSSFSLVYKMPLYYKVSSARNMLLFNMLKSEWQQILYELSDSKREKKLNAIYDYLAGSDIAEYQELADLIYVTRDFRDDWMMEVSKRNVAEDINGNIIWLDMLFV